MNIRSFTLDSVVVDCGNLQDIPNGQVRLSTTTFGSTATYTCDPGYSVVGTSTRTCLASGFWSGREPTCTRKNLPPREAPTIIALLTCTHTNTQHLPVDH